MKKLNRQVTIQGLLIALSYITVFGFAIATAVVIWKATGWWCLLWLAPAATVKLQKVHLNWIGWKTVRGDFNE